MTTVTVTPKPFSYVNFDADEIAALAQRLAADVGIPEDLDIAIIVDETTPLGFNALTGIDPITIEAESGAFEDPKKLREFSAAAATEVIGRHLMRAVDRLDSDFGEPPVDSDLTLAQRNAWEIYACGRLVRLGHPTHRQRRLYQFRSRHGFTDAADKAFEEIWASEKMSWDELMRISEEAQAVNPGRLSA